MPQAVEAESSKHWTTREFPGIISFKRDLQSSVAFSDWVGEASTHPVKVSMNIRKYLYPDRGGIWVIPNCQSSPRYVELACIMKGELNGPVGYYRHTNRRQGLLVLLCFLSPFPERLFRQVLWCIPPIVGGIM